VFLNLKLKSKKIVFFFFFPALPTKARIFIVFRFIIEYSSSMDFEP
jgi:hypothetical protein